MSNLELTTLEVEELLVTAFRLGILEALRHRDVIEALDAPGIIRRSLDGELAFRRHELQCRGFDADRVFADWGLQ